MRKTAGKMPGKAFQFYKYTEDSNLQSKLYKVIDKNTCRQSA
jgi:hypothetical protein